MVFIVYYARSENSSGEMETVARHLARAGGLCAEFLAPAGLQAWGTALGTTHDFGKYSDAFQQVLQGKAAGVNHALPSAVLLQALYSRRTADLLSAVTASHHGVLRGYGDYAEDAAASCTGSGNLLDRSGKIISLCGAEAYRNAMREWRKDFTKTALPQSPDFSREEDAMLSRMLFERLLFSALIDADWCSSAGHFDPEYLAERTGPALDAEAAMERLRALQREKREHSAASDALNRMRDQLFDVCLQAGDLEPGLFTVTAPTGLGKTLALMAFALQHCIRWGKRRIIFVLPYLSIIEQNGKDYRQIIPELLEIHSNVRWSADAGAMAERWDAPCIVTTNVGFFEPLFSAQPGVCRHLHQFADSVIVLDEAQSLPQHLLDATLRTVKLLCSRYGCTAVFSTATQPSFQHRPGLAWDPREIVPNAPELFASTRRTVWEWRHAAPVPLSALAEELSGLRQCCIIVNLKRHARTLLDQISLLRPESEVFYLTTDLCPAHRSDLLEEVRRRLRAGAPCCLIATQCIEAGVDLDFPVLYRAMAPLESLIQAAGRCNRNGDRPDGKVVVFVPDEDRLYPSEEYGRGALCTLTLLSRHHGELDCSDLSVADEYDQLRYGFGNGDRRALRDAIQQEDYEETERQYQWIDTEGIQIIVPYAARQPLYRSICARLERDGLSRRLICDARELTVSCFDRQAAEQYCTALMYRSRETGQLTPSGYWLLGVPQFYDSRRGLYWNNLFDGIF